MAEKDNVIGLAMGLDVTDLKAGINEVKKLVKQSKDEFNLATAGLDKWTNSSEGLTAKLKQLDKQLGAQKKAVAGYKAEIEEVSKKEGDHTVQLEQLRKKLLDAEIAVKKTETQINKYGDSLSRVNADNFVSALDNIKGLGANVAKGLATVGATVGGLATAFFATAESTRELRTNMGKVETAFTTAGLSAEQAAQTYQNLYSVVADEGKATEATSHIAKLAKSQEDLSKWVNISTGVYATFGDSLPIENLAEASNETAKTGQITGGLADALNWAGVSEEAFQEKLDNLSTEQERNQLITETLNGLYSEASEKYQQTNKDVIESNKAQAELSNTMAELGAKAEPIMTSIRNGFNQILQSIIQLISGADFEAIKAGIESAFAYFIDTIIPAIVNGFQWIMDNKDILIAGIVAIGTAMLAWNVVSMIQGVVTAIKGWQKAVEGLTVAQKLLDLVQKATPMGLIISLIAGLVAGFIHLWNTSDKFRQFWIDMWEGLKNAVGVVVDWIKENWQSLLLFIVSPLAGVFKILYDNFEGFRKVVQKVLNAVKKFFTDAWNSIKKTWSASASWFSNIASKVVSAFKNIPNNIKTFFTNAWNNIKKAWSNVTSFFVDIKEKIINSFKNLPSQMLSVGTDLVKGLWNGIKDMSSWIIGKIKGFTGDVLGGIKKFFGIKSPSREMAKIGKFLDEGLAQGIEKNEKVVTKATDELGKNVLTSLSGIEKELENANIKEKILALGGKVENPFAKWTWRQLDGEATKLKSQLDSINEKIIANGVTQEQWGESQEKINERAKLLEERLIAQNKLIDVINARLPKTLNQDVKNNYSEMLQQTQNDIEVTKKEFAELEDKVTSQPEKKTWLDNMFSGIGKSLGVADDDMDEFVKSTKGKLKEIGGAFGDLFSTCFDAWNQQIDQQIESLDRELEAYNEIKDEELEIITNKSNAELENLEELKENKTVTDEDYAAKKLEIENRIAAEQKRIEEEKRKQEQETLRKKDKLARKQFNAQKANDIAQAVIQGALAIVKGFAELGPIGGAINAAIQAGITAVQVGTIASQQYVPMLAKGGIVENATLAMIGEDGKEAVVPLENNTGWIRELAEKLNEVMQKDFSFGMNVNQLQPVYAGQPVVNNYYYQTINSPQQLNRREIYRDSKNLLALKG